MGRYWLGAELWKCKKIWDKAIDEKILNDVAQNGLKAKLERIGYIAEKRTEFDFINIPFSEWDNEHYQHLSFKITDFGIEELWNDFTGLFVVLGSFTFKFLAKGKILYTENGFDIQIEQVAGFVHDVFNFDEDYYGDFLGFWNCADKQMNIYEFIDGQWWVMQDLEILENIINWATILLYYQSKNWLT